jgi:hypothetical protein
LQSDGKRAQARIRRITVAKKTLKKAKKMESKKTLTVAIRTHGA